MLHNLTSMYLCIHLCYVFKNGTEEKSALFTSESIHFVDAVDSNATDNLWHCICAYVQFLMSNFESIKDVKARSNIKPSLQRIYRL